MAKNPQQKTVQISPHTDGLIRELAAAIEGRTGERVSLGNLVNRAVACLKDSHAGDAWLSGEEAGRALEERHRKAILNTLGVVVPIVTKGAMKVTGMSVDTDRELAFLHLEGGDMLQLGYRALADEPVEPVEAA